MSYFKNLSKTVCLNTDGSINPHHFDHLWNIDVFDLYSDRMTSAVHVGRTHSLRTELLRLAVEKNTSFASRYILDYLEKYTVAIQAHGDNILFENEQIYTQVSMLQKQYPELWKKTLLLAKPASTQQEFLLDLETNAILDLDKYKPNAKWGGIFIQLAQRCVENPEHMRQVLMHNPALLNWIVSGFFPNTSGREHVLTGRYTCENAFARDLDLWLVPLIEKDDAITDHILVHLEKALSKNGKIRKERSILPSVLYTLRNSDTQVQQKIMHVLYPLVDIRKTYSSTVIHEYWDKHDFSWMSNQQRDEYVGYLYEHKEKIPAGLLDAYRSHVERDIFRRRDKNLILQHLFTTSNAKQMLVNDDTIAMRLKIFQERFHYESTHSYIHANVSIRELMDLFLERNFLKTQEVFEHTRLYQYLILDKLLVFRFNNVNHVEHYLGFLSTAAEWIQQRHHTTEHLLPIQRLMQSYILKTPYGDDERLETMDILAKYLLPGINISLRSSIQSYDQLKRDEFIDPNTTTLQDHINNVIQLSYTTTENYDVDSMLEMHSF